ncbi:MAG: hypothetical protein QOD77_531 [Thermoplasmata archaeon]|nr:hypothetical protein [Thermoplasmata archaeon]
MRILLAAAIVLAAFAALPTASAWEPPAIPCQTGIAGTDCSVGAFDCAVGVGYRTGGASYQYAGAWCGRPTWYPCVLAYADTNGNVASCLLG